MGIKVNLIGQKFNRLTVISEAPKRNNSTSSLWVCECDCKNHTNVSTSNLKTGHSKSCGCIRNEQVIQRNKLHATHGHTTNRSPSHEYYIWVGIKSRCYNINHNYYKYYGGHGIKMYNDWLNSFECFYAYIGKCPTVKHTIDRINNNGNYEPGNIRWATRKEQANNRTNTRLFNYNGGIKTASQLAEIAGISFATMKHRLLRGWKAERAVTQLVKPKYHSVIKMDLLYNIKICTYASIADAANDNRVNESNIRQAIKAKRACRGYKWMYVDGCLPKI